MTYTTTTLRVAGKIVAFSDHRPPYERGPTLHWVRVDGQWRAPTPAERAAVPDDWCKFDVQQKAGEP